MDWAARGDACVLGAVGGGAAHGIQIVQEIQGRTFAWDGVRGNVLWSADVSEVDKGRTIVRW